ncbi:MAG: AraC family transcriptional regulator [Bacillota bacterium]|nr:AraC family transcriptional regulator [Bacillota bacterium]
MGYRKDMEDCRAYIDENLYNELSAEYLANKYGYSFFHFCHIFRISNGRPVMSYIRSQRLKRGAAEIAAGATVTEVAIKAGFDTPSGFNKAFRREFGTNPSQYTLSLNSTSQRKGYISMRDPKIVTKESFKAAGYLFKPGKDVDIKKDSAYWIKGDYSQISPEEYKEIAAENLGEIGCWTHPEAGGDLSYFFGPILKGTENVPPTAATIEIPDGTFAVFTTDPLNIKGQAHAAFAQQINDAWKYIFEQWLDQSDYVYDHAGICYEFYDKRCGIEDGAQMDLYLPVKKK